MKRKLTSSELAERWEAGVMPLHTAVWRHWKRLGLWPVHQKVMMAVELILGFANLGFKDALIQVNENEEITVGEAVDRFQMWDFLG